MLRAKNKKGKIIIAQYANKNEAYICPICNGEVVLRKGEIMRPYFAHKSLDKCTDKWNYDNKSSWHIRHQNYFDVKYQEVVMDLNGEKHIADVCQDGVVIEFQKSLINKENFLARKRFYNKLGYQFVYVFEAQGLYEENIMQFKYNGNGKIKLKNPRKVWKYWGFPNDHDLKNAFYLSYYDKEIQSDVWCKVIGAESNCVGEPDFRYLTISKEKIVLKNYRHFGIFDKNPDFNSVCNESLYPFSPSRLFKSEEESLELVLKSRVFYDKKSNDNFCPKTKARISSTNNLFESPCNNCSSCIAIKKRGVTIREGYDTYCNYPAKTNYFSGFMPRQLNSKGTYIE